MRTTVNLDDDVFERVKEIARVRQVSLGEALSDLARKGMGSAEVKISPATGLPVISLPGRILNQDVARAQEEDLDR